MRSIVQSLYKEWLWPHFCLLQTTYTKKRPTAFHKEVSLKKKLIMIINRFALMCWR